MPSFRPMSLLFTFCCCLLLLAIDIVARRNCLRSTAPTARCAPLPFSSLELFPSFFPPLPLSLFFFPLDSYSFISIPWSLDSDCTLLSVPHPLHRCSSRPPPTPHSGSTMVLIDKHEHLSEEEKRLKEDRERTRYWKRWGPYVAERQWATGRSWAAECCLTGPAR